MRNRVLYKYNSEYHDAWAWSLAIKGATMKDIADAFGVDVHTVMSWAKPKVVDGSEVETSFGKALKASKQAADAVVERKLYDRCKGYDYYEEHTIKNAKQGKDDTAKAIQTRVIKKHIPPETI